MSEGPIPLTAIIQYGLFYECGKDLTTDLIEYISVLDEIYLKHIDSKRTAK